MLLPGCSSKTGRPAAFDEDHRGEILFVKDIVVPGRNVRQLPSVALIGGPLGQVDTVVVIVVTPGTPAASSLSNMVGCVQPPEGGVSGRIWPNEVPAKRYMRLPMVLVWTGEKNDRWWQIA